MSRKKVCFLLTILRNVLKFGCVFFSWWMAKFGTFSHDRIFSAIFISVKWCDVVVSFTIHGSSLQNWPISMVNSHQSNYSSHFYRHVCLTPSFSLFLHALPLAIIFRLHFSQTHIFRFDFIKWFVCLPPWNFYLLHSLLNLCLLLFTRPFLILRIIANDSLCHFLTVKRLTMSLGVNWEMVADQNPYLWLKIGRWERKSSLREATRSNSNELQFYFYFYFLRPLYSREKR